VNPHAFGQKRVRSGDVEGHGAGGCVDADCRFHELLVHSVVDEVVPGLDELRRREAPFVAAADHEGMLGRGLEAPVDNHEPLVLAERDARHSGGDLRRAVETVVRQPVVLGAVRDIDLEAGHPEGREGVAGLEVLDRGEAAVGEPHKRPEEEAVAAASAAAAGPSTARGTPAAR